MVDKKKPSSMAKARSLKGSYEIADKKETRLKKNLSKYTNKEGSDLASIARLQYRTKEGKALSRATDRATDEKNKISIAIRKNRSSVKQK